MNLSQDLGSAYNIMQVENDSCMNCPHLKIFLTLIKMTMKRFLILTIMAIGIPALTWAQPERIGAGLTFTVKKRFNGGDTGNPGLNLRTWIPVDKRKALHIVPSVSVFNPHKINHVSHITTTYMFHGDLDLQYRLFHEKSLKLIGVGGVNYTHIISRNKIEYSVPDIPVDSTLSGFGPTVGLSLEMRMSSNWDFIVSGRYSFTGLRAGDPTLGEKFLVAPMSTPVIQVHAVYYFRSRGRGYSYR